MIGLSLLLLLAACGQQAHGASVNVKDDEIYNVIVVNQTGQRANLLPLTVENGKIPLFNTKYDLNETEVHITPLRESSDSDDDDRIVGGRLAENHSRPWQALLLSNEGGLCGGTIIHPYWILTAAHCISTNPSASITLTVGTNRWCMRYGGVTYLSYGDGYVNKQVVLIVMHAYNSASHANDIAMLKLDSPLSINRNIQLAQLPSSPPTQGDMLEVSGWGTTSEGGTTSCELMTVSVPVSSESLCYQAYGIKPGDGNFCAGYPQGGKDSCQGDSGGPLVKLYTDGAAVINGIVSFGKGCGRPYFPGVYAKVYSYVDWIKSVISHY